VPPAADIGWQLECQACRARFSVSAMLRGCPDCAARGQISLLELQRRLPLSPAPLSARTGRGLTRWLDLLPVADPDAWFSLGEGGTALVRSRIIGRRLGLPNLYFKLEQQNPTFSFKDRFVAITVNAARAFGYRRVVVSSTGNLALSVAAYAAAAGMACVVIVPHGVPPGIAAEAALYGARVAVIAPELRFQALEAAAGCAGWFPVGLFLRRRVQNAFGVEGYRSFAYEIVEELGEAPGAVLFPCARGNGLYGAWKGFLDCRALGWTTRMPRMIAAQPEGANSLEMSLVRNTGEALELPPVRSVAKSTSESVAGDDALRAIRQSGGTALSADDDAIRQAVAALGEEGLNAESGAALPVACLPKLLDGEKIDRDAVLVCVLTAAGLRWPEQADWIRPQALAVQDIAAFTDFLNADGANAR